MSEILHLLKETNRIERQATELFGTTNVNVRATATEILVSGYLAWSTGCSFKHLGGNQRGYDIIDSNGITYEVKHTHTSKSHFNYGGLIDKDADYVTFIQWGYLSDTVRSATVIPTTEVQTELDQRGRISNRRLSNLKGQDITNDFNNYLHELAQN